MPSEHSETTISERGSTKEIEPPKPLAEGTCQRFLGILYAILSGLSVTATAVCQKKLKNLPPPQFCTYRYLGVLVYSVLAMIYHKQSPARTKKVTILISTRGSLLGVSYIAFFYALNFVPLTDYSALSASSPVFSIIMARIFLKELCSVIHIACLVLTVIGIVLVSKLPLVLATRTNVYNTSYFGGVGLVLLFNVVVGFATVVIRVPEVKRTHNSVILFYLGVLAVCECSLLSAAMYGFTPPPCGPERFFPIMLSVSGVGIDIFAVLGLQYQTAAVFILIYSSSNIIGSYLWSIMVEGVIPDAYTVSGTVVMVACIVILSLGQYILRLFKGKYSK